MSSIETVFLIQYKLHTHIAYINSILKNWGKMYSIQKLIPLKMLYLNIRLFTSVYSRVPNFIKLFRMLRKMRKLV